MKNHNGSIYVDFDGTLATYNGYKGPEVLGEPIPVMVHRILAWIANGETVKVFTARADTESSVQYIKRWLRTNGLPDLEVTNVKGPDCYAFYDDRALRVVKNTGLLECELYADFFKKLFVQLEEVERTNSSSPISTANLKTDWIAMCTKVYYDNIRRQ